MGFLEGTKARPLESAGAPTNGENEEHNLAFTGGVPTSGTFVLVFAGFRTVPIAFNAIASVIEDALEALPSFGPGNVAVSGGPMGATTIVSFVGGLGKLFIGTLITEDLAFNTLDNNAVLNITLELAGTTAFRRGSGAGALAIDVTNGVEYVNTGTAVAPTWIVVGTQT